MKRTPMAVIDLGSNTARVVVFQIEVGGSFEVLADDKVPLRLIRQLDPHKRLREVAQQKTLRVLTDFRRIAMGAGAKKIIAVATAAVREASNGPEFLKRARLETRIAVRLLDPDSEARCSFLGAIYGVAVGHGMVLDIGGGSLQLGHFRNRRLLTTWSLPLGALRLSDRILRKNPPSRQQVLRLKAYAGGLLDHAGIPELREDEILVGTGGTIRNLGKLDTRLREYPITRLHGYILTARRTRVISGLLTSHRTEELASLPGLNPSRIDSIVGGSLLAESVMEHVGAERLLVAGLGLREGLLLQALGSEIPAASAVRRGAVAALVGRFASWDARRASRRRKLAETMLSALMPEDATGLFGEMLGHAAVLLDIGRSVDYYRRHEHAAMILRSAGLSGFGHREIMQLSLIIEMADDLEWKIKVFRPLLRNGDLEEIAKGAVLLALADEIEHRVPARRIPGLRCTVRGDTVRLSEKAIVAWDPGSLEVSFARVFGKNLKIVR